MFQIKKESKVHQIIPDNNKKGLTNTIKIVQSGRVKDIVVSVDISHNFISDLEVQLITPSRKTISLHRRGGENKKNLNVKYGSQELAELHNTEAEGDWKLKVRDLAPKDPGTLNSWSIQMKCSGLINEVFVPAKSKTFESVQDCQIQGRVSDLKMQLKLEHPSIGDLQIALVAPSGKSILLQDFSEDNKSDLNTTYKKEALEAMIGQSTKGSWILRIKDRTGKKRGTLKKWKLEFKYQEVDDLKKMEGIGPKIEKLLNAANIYSWSKLSVTHPDQIRGILAAAGDRFKMHDPTTWPQQAQLAAAGNWEQLKKWQDELNGGRLN